MESDDDVKRYASQGVEEDARRAVQLLADHGADLSRPRPVTHYFDAPGEEQAKRLAADVGSDYDVEILAPEEGDSAYAVVARHVIAVSAEALLDLRAGFDELAGCVDGKYDGWESTLVDDERAT